MSPSFSSRGKGHAVSELVSTVPTHHTARTMMNTGVPVLTLTAANILWQTCPHHMTNTRQLMLPETHAAPTTIQH